MPDSKDKVSAAEQRAKKGVARGDTSPPVLDPKNPASKPRGTTKDQVSEMESEGQGQTPTQPPADIDEKSGKVRPKGRSHGG